MGVAERPADAVHFDVWVDQATAAEVRRHGWLMDLSDEAAVRDLLAGATRRQREPKLVDPPQE